MDFFLAFWLIVFFDTDSVSDGFRPYPRASWRVTAELIETWIVVLVPVQRVRLPYSNRELLNFTETIAK